MKEVEFLLYGGVVPTVQRKCSRILGTTIRERLIQRVDFKETLFSCNERMILVYLLEALTIVLLLTAKLQ